MPKHKVLAHEEKPGNIWQRLSVGERITIILTAIGVIAALLVVPEVRYFLHLEKRPAEEAQKPSGNPEKTPPQQAQRNPAPANAPAPKLKIVPLPNAPDPDDNRRLITQNPIPETLNGTKTTWETATLVTVPESISHKLLVKSVTPEYPPLARQARVAGKVVLEVHVGTDGSVESVKPVSGHPLLSGTAVSAVEQWKYTPYMYKGKAISMDTTVTVNFESTDGLYSVHEAETAGSNGEMHGEEDVRPEKHPN